jgi:hypothetical protein
MKRLTTIGGSLFATMAALAGGFAGSSPAVSQGEAGAAVNKRVLTFDYVGSTEGFAPIPFERVRDEIFFKAKINGIEATVLLDNGTDTTEIDTGFAARAGSKTHGTGVVRTGTANIPVRMVDNVKVVIPHHLTVSGTVVAADLSALAKIIGHPVDAVLGGDVVNANAMALMNDKRQLYLMPSGKIAANAKGVIVPLVNNGEIAAEINGKPVRLFIDLGANGDVILSDGSWGRVIPVNAPVTTSRFTTGDGIIRERKRSTGNAVQIGGSTARGIEVNSEVRDPRGLDGSIGNAFLSHYNVMFDAPARKLLLIPSQGRVGS